MENKDNKKECKCFYVCPIIVLMSLILILIGTGLSIVFTKIGDLPESFVISYAIMWMVLAAVCIGALIFFIFAHKWCKKEKTAIDVALEEEVLKVIKGNQETEKQEELE